MAVVTKFPRRRSLVVLADSFASTKLVQDELLRSKMTYRELAATAAVSKSTVNNIATGQTRFPRIETIIRILGALRWTIQASRAEEEEA